LSLDVEDMICFNTRFESYELLDGDKILVLSTDGTSTGGRILIAADGVRSRVSKDFLPEFRLLVVERMTIWGRTPLTPYF
jgi:2-polyprenyl-6-methoxyphenol hydroxylase-like FAD-dependent oxidoreductase